MEEKNFVAYEYKTKTVKAEDQPRAADMYEAFGWEITSAAPSLGGGVALSLKRDRKIAHKQELNKTERQAESVFETLLNLKRSVTLGASVFAYILGVVGDFFYYLIYSSYFLQLLLHLSRFLIFDLFDLLFF